MKRLLLLLVMLLLVSTVHAIDLKTGPQALSVYFPEETVLFASIRIDEGFIEQLDTLSTTIATQIPESVGAPTLSGTLRDAFAESGVDFDAFIGFLGDYAALGFITLDPSAASQDNGYLVALLDDRAAAENFFQSNTEAEYTASTEGDYTVYTTTANTAKVAFGTDVLIVTSTQDTALPVLPLVTSLQDRPQYVAAAGQLPADAYNLVVYMDLAGIMASTPQTPGFEVGGSLALGFTIQDAASLTIDAVQTPTSAGSAGAADIDPAFTRFIPERTSAFIHATDFTSLFNNTLMSLADLSAAPGSTPDVREQVVQGLMSLGIDLDADLLSWTTGDYVLMTRTDVRAGIEGLMSGGSFDINTLLDFGIVFEATDPTKAQAFATKLGSLFTLFLGSAEGLTVTTEPFAGSTATVINVQTEAAPGMQINYDILIGANDEIFFIANRRAAEAITSGANPITNSAAYTAASAYLLPNPTSVWYTDGEGFVAVVGGGVVGTLAFLGPSIGSVFENQLDQLNGQSGALTPQAQPIAQGGTPEIQAVLNAINLIESSTISTSVAPDGSNIVRAVLTYRRAAQ